jgi:SAM-dependent methyltransferase
MWRKSMSRKRSLQEEPLSPAAVRELAVGFQRSRVLLTAFELDIFTALGKGARPSNQVAQALGTEKRATDRLMNALCSIGFLRKRSGLFSNATFASRFLVKGKPEYMAGLMHTAHLWNTWSTLTRAVRRGASVVAGRTDAGAAKWRAAFIAAMHERASKIAPSVVGMLGLSRVCSVLDVGGGSGEYSMAFALAKKGLRATVFDLPDIIPLTRKYVKKNGFLDRVDFVAGDYTTDDLGRGDQRGQRSRRAHNTSVNTGPESRPTLGFDLVFLSAIVHSNSIPENRKLMRKCVKALNPGGQVVVQDFIMNEDRTGPAPAALFALNMLVGTEAGDTYTESEVRSWMKAAGLRSIVRKDTEFGTTLIIGRKAG